MEWTNVNFETKGVSEMLFGEWEDIFIAVTGQIEFKQDENIEESLV